MLMHKLELGIHYIILQSTSPSQLFCGFGAQILEAELQHPPDGASVRTSPVWDSPGCLEPGGGWELRATKGRSYREAMEVRQIPES